MPQMHDAWTHVCARSKRRMGCGVESELATADSLVPPLFYLFVLLSFLRLCVTAVVTFSLPCEPPCDACR